MLGKSATAIGNEIRSGGVAKKLGRPQKVSPRSSDPPPGHTPPPNCRFFMRSVPPQPAHLAPKQVFCALVAHIYLSSKRGPFACLLRP